MGGSVIFREGAFQYFCLNCKEKMHFKCGRPVDGNEKNRLCNKPGNPLCSPILLNPAAGVPGGAPPASVGPDFLLLPLPPEGAHKTALTIHAWTASDSEGERFRYEHEWAYFREQESLTLNEDCDTEAGTVGAYEPSVADVSLATGQLNAFLPFMDMDTLAFNLLNLGHQRVHDFLGVTNPPPRSLSNSSITLKTLRDIFCPDTESVLLRSGPHVARSLLKGKVLCRVCHLHGAVKGTMESTRRKVDRHVNTSGHSRLSARAPGTGTVSVERVPQSATVQSRVDDDFHRAGRRYDQDKRARVIATGSLVAGGNGAAGSP